MLHYETEFQAYIYRRFHSYSSQLFATVCAEHSHDNWELVTKVYNHLVDTVVDMVVAQLITSEQAKKLYYYLDSKYNDYKKKENKQ